MNGYVKLAYYYSDYQSCGNRSEREGSEFNFAEQETEAKGEEERYQRVIL